VLACTCGSESSFYSGPAVIPPNYNAVVAQDLDVFTLGPEPRRRTLPRPGMPDKQIPSPIGPDDAAAVQFDRSLLREAMHDQEFVEGILKGKYRVAHACEIRFVHLDGCPAELAIHDQSFVRMRSQHRSAEVKLEFCSTLVQLPERA
jgi:hypothetical protein